MLKGHIESTSELEARTGVSCATSLSQLLAEKPSVMANGSKNDAWVD